MTERLEDLFTRHSINLLGFADAAFVFSRPESADYAVKVGLDVADGWPAWAAWCAGQPSPHLPRIRSCSWVHDPAGRPLLFVGVVERLYPSLVARRWIKARPELKRAPTALADYVAASHPGVATMLRAAARAFPHAHWDMGGPNWMERADGTLVLTDPLSVADRAPGARARRS